MIWREEHKKKIIKRLEERLGKKVRPVKRGEQYQVGKTYYNGYWGQTFTVLDITSDNWEKYVCLWADGEITKHCTPLDPERDFVVIN